MAQMVEKRYRNNVCAVIRRNSDNSVLFFHRIGMSQNEGWQFPQGGINSSKDFVEELKRELREEIGTDSITIISISNRNYIYDFPNSLKIKHSQYHGQKQRWVLAELNPADTIVNVHTQDPEFDAFKWITPENAIKEIVEFKRDVYRKALFDFGLI